MRPYFHLNILIFSYFQITELLLCLAKYVSKIVIYIPLEREALIGTAQAEDGHRALVGGHPEDADHVRSRPVGIRDCSEGAGDRRSIRG